MKRIFVLILSGLLLLTGCGAGGQVMDGEIVSEGQSVSEEQTTVEEQSTSQSIRLKINEVEVPVSWEDNASVEELRALLPLTISLHMYGGFEQVGPIGQSLISEDEQTTTDAGDIVLYSSNQIVLFYGSNFWAYTRLGHMDLPDQELTELLSNGDVTILLYE